MQKLKDSMENFSNFITEQKNTHMTHIEDKVLYGGVDGTREAINALRGLRDMLSGTGSGRVSVNGTVVSCDLRWSRST